RGSDAPNTAALIRDSRYTFPGVSDGGAHTKFFNGGSYTTDFLLWLVREEKQLTLEEAHYRLSTLPAHAAGFRDRGMLREGAPAAARRQRTSTSTPRLTRARPDRKTGNGC